MPHADKATHFQYFNLDVLRIQVNEILLSVRPVILTEIKALLLRFILK